MNMTNYSLSIESRMRTIYFRRFNKVKVFGSKFQEGYRVRRQPPELGHNYNNQDGPDV